MNILYLSYDGATDPLGQSQILPYLVGLAPHHSITLVTFEKRERLQIHYRSVQEQIKKSTIIWIPLRYHKYPPVISTLFDLFFLWRKVNSVRKQRSFHLVHCRSYITALVGLRLKKKQGIPFLFDMRGFWADERVEGGLWNLRNPFYRIIYNRFKVWEKEFVQFADGVITLTHAGRKEVLSWKLNPSVEVIPCCVDDTLFDPTRIDRARKQELRKELSIGPDDFVLVYAGSLGTWYLVTEMMAFYSVLRKRITPSKFLILTTEAFDSSRWTWQGEIILRSVRREEMPLHLSLANASVFFIKPTYSKKGSSATKMAELMAMNVPFVTNAGWGDVAEVVSKENGGLQISRLDEASFGQAVEELTFHPVPLSRPIAQNYFSLANGIHLYDQLYARLGKADS